MKKIFYVAFVIATLSTPLMAQEKRGMHDPKVRSERIAEKLHFSEDQKNKLELLNEKYSGESYDKQAYKKEFQDMLTANQKKQLQKWKEEHRQKPVKKS